MELRESEGMKLKKCIGEGEIVYFKERRDESQEIKSKVYENLLMI